MVCTWRLLLHRSEEEQRRRRGRGERDGSPWICLEEEAVGLLRGEGKEEAACGGAALEAAVAVGGGWMSCRFWGCVSWPDDTERERERFWAVSGLLALVVMGRGPVVWAPIWAWLGSPNLVGWIWVAAATASALGRPHRRSSVRPPDPAPCRRAKERKIEIREGEKNKGWREDDMWALHVRGSIIFFVCKQ